MWTVLAKVGTAKRAKEQQEAGYLAEYEGLKKRGWFYENEMPYEDFIKFRKFYGIYQSAHKESLYYTVLNDYITNLYGEGESLQEFRKQDIARLLQRWEYWEKQAEAAGEKALERLRAGKFVPADSIRR